MDVTRIKLVGLSDVELPISVALPSDPYIMKSAEGLGPTGLDVSIASSTVQGGFYQGRRAQNRQMVFHVGLNPDFRAGQTAAKLRSTLYSLLSPTSADDSINVGFYFGTTLVAQVRGWVSSIEPVLFSKEPEVQVTIDTAWPYLEAPAVLVATPSLRTGFDIVNAGTANTGFEVSITFTSAVATWSLQLDGNERFRLDYNFLAGDVLTFNTLPGSRSVSVKRGTSETSLLFAIEKNAVWLRLHGGTNRFSTSTQTFTWNYFRYLPQFLGV